MKLAFLCCSAYSTRMIKTFQTKGTTKSIRAGADAGESILYFDDTIRVWDGPTQKSISGKGILNNRISAHLMTCLESIGLPTHFLKSLNMREQQVRTLDPMPIVIRLRNVAAGSLAERLRLDVGTILPRPIIEFYCKNKSGDYTLVTEDHIIAFQWADPAEMEEVMTIVYRANDYMNGLMAGLNIRLVDFQIEIGRLYGEYGELYLMIMDELSPDSMRLWDMTTNQELSRDIEGYQDIAKRLGVIPKEDYSEAKVENLETIENILAQDAGRKIRPIGKMPPRQNSRT